MLVPESTGEQASSNFGALILEEMEHSLPLPEVNGQQERRRLQIRWCGALVLFPQMQQAEQRWRRRTQGDLLHIVDASMA